MVGSCTSCSYNFFNGPIVFFFLFCVNGAFSTKKGKYTHVANTLKINIAHTFYCGKEIVCHFAQLCLPFSSVSFHQRRFFLCRSVRCSFCNFFVVFVWVCPCLTLSGLSLCLFCLFCVFCLCLCCLFCLFFLFCLCIRHCDCV